MSGLNPSPPDPLSPKRGEGEKTRWDHANRLGFRVWRAAKCGKDKPFRLGYVNDLGYAPNQIAQLQNVRVGLGYGNLPLALQLAGVGQTDGLPPQPPSRLSLLQWRIPF